MLPTMQYTERDTTPNLAANVGRFVIYQGRLARVVAARAVRKGQEITLRVQRRPAGSTAHEIIGRPAQSAVYAGRGRYVRLDDFAAWPVVVAVERQGV